MENIIQIKNLDFNYGERCLFSHFNLNIPENSFIAIAGRNASGKTTLFRLMAGILPSHNQIIFDHGYIDSERMDHHVVNMGIVLSSLETVFLRDTVYQELVFPLENLKMSSTEIENRIKEVCSFFGIKMLLDKKIEELTVAEARKLSIVLAFVHHPRVVLLDGGFAMLSQKDASFFLQKVKKWKEKYGTTIVVFTTSLEDALEADYLYVLEQGHIKIEGRPMAVMQEEKLLRQLGLELPFMMDLSSKFRCYNLISEDIVDMNRMVDQLWK